MASTTDQSKPAPHPPDCHEALALSATSIKS